MKVTNATQYVQESIIRTLVTDLLEAGYLIDVNDNDADRETHLAESRDLDAIMGAIFNDEIDSVDYILDLRHADRQHSDRSTEAYVRLIDGNGASVISDYTTNLEAADGIPLHRATTLANNIDDMGEEAWVIDHMRKLEAALRKWVAYGEENGGPENYSFLAESQGALQAGSAN